MNILHVMYDGYHPDNKYEVVKPENVISESDYPVRRKLLSEDTDVGTDYLQSAYMWCRFYSSWEPYDAYKKFSENNSKTSNHLKMMSIPKEDWLWNKMSKHNINTIIYPFYTFNYLITRNNSLLYSDDCNKDLINMMVRPYYQKYYSLLDKGEEVYRDSDYQYSDLVKELISYMANLKTNPCQYEIVDEFYDIWDRGDPEELSRELPRLAEFYEDNMIDPALKSITENYEIFKSEIYPWVISKLSNDKDNYIHIGIGETDLIWHCTEYCDEFATKCQEILLHKILKELIDIVNPDIIIVNGDHGMVNSFESSSRRSTKAEFNYKGSTYKVKKPHSGVAPLCNDHTNTVGGYIWSKPEYRNIIDKVCDIHDETMSNRYRDNRSPLLLDTLYNWLSELEGYNE